jgi:hypothetical protein
MPDLEDWQKILLKCGGNAGSGPQCWQNLAEKVTAQKIDLTPIDSYALRSVRLHPYA